MVLNRETEVLGITDPLASRPHDSDKPPENCLTPRILSGTSTWTPPSNIFGNTEPWERSEHAQSKAGSSFLGSGCDFHVHNLSMTSRRAHGGWSCLPYCKAGKNASLSQSQYPDIYQLLLWLSSQRRRGEVTGERETEKWGGRKKKRKRQGKRQEVKPLYNILLKCQLSQNWVTVTKYLTTNSSHTALCIKSRILYHSQFLNKHSGSPSWYLPLSAGYLTLMWQLSYILWVKAYRTPSRIVNDKDTGPQMDEENQDILLPWIIISPLHHSRDEERHRFRRTPALCQAAQFQGASPTFRVSVHRAAKLSSFHAATGRRLTQLRVTQCWWHCRQLSLSAGSIWSLPLKEQRFWENGEVSQKHRKQGSPWGRRDGGWLSRERCGGREAVDSLILPRMPEQTAAGEAECLGLAVCPQGPSGKVLICILDRRVWETLLETDRGGKWLSSQDPVMRF